MSIIHERGCIFTLLPGVGFIEPKAFAQPVIN